MNSRRDFIRCVSLSGAVLWGGEVLAQAPLVDEKDPTAAALGYVADAARVDKAKYPKFATGQTCAGCALYQGKAGDKSGACPLYAGKQVTAAGWCSAYAKKA